MIVRNEEDNVRPCIDPLLPVLDEVIIVDTGSTDGTKRVAKELGANVYDFPWCDDFSAARNESIRHATGDYILWLDADDRIDEENIGKLQLLKNKFPPTRDTAYYLIINSQSPVDGETYFRQLRIFPRVKGGLFEGKVHEQIYFSLKCQRIKFENIDIEIRHLGYKDSEVIFKKAQRNLSIIEGELKVRPDDLVLHYNAARTLALMGRQKEAIAHMKFITENKLVKEQEKQFFLESTLLIGKYYLELKSYTEAIFIFNSLAKDFNDNALVHFCLGQAYFLSQNYDQALESFQKALLCPLEVSLFPVNLSQLQYDLHYSLGRCFLEKGQCELAKDQLLRSLKFKNDPYKSYQALGLVYMKEGNFGEALKNFEKVTASGMLSDQEYALMGFAYQELGLYNQAEEILQKALEINPGKIEALTNLGYLYYENMNYQQAEEVLKRALNYNPDLIDVRLILSEIYFRLYELDDLVSQCDNLLRLLNLNRHITINNFRELSDQYIKIAHTLSSRGREELSLLAWRAAFLIYPQEELLKIIINKASALGLKEKIIRALKEILQFHQQREEIKKFGLFAN